MSEPSLEDLLGQLEAAVARLADPAAPLERLVTDHELAVALLARAQARLDAAAARVAAGGQAALQARERPAEGTR